MRSAAVNGMDNRALRPDLKQRVRGGAAHHAVGNPDLVSPLHNVDLARQQMDLFNDSHDLNTIVETEHGDYTVAQIYSTLETSEMPKHSVYSRRETFGFDEHGNPVVVREQQHLLEIVPLEKRLQPYIGKWIMLLIQIVWNAVQWAGVIGTIYMDGFDMYTHYFTNWMWTIGTLYNTVDILCFLDPTGHLHFYWNAAAFWPVFGNVAQVFWLVFIMICDNPHVIADPASEYGFCPVLLVDRIKHVLPFLERLLYLILRAQDFIAVLYRVSVYGWRAIAGYIALQFVFAHLVLFGYWSNFDFYAVYGLSLNVWVGLAIVEVIYLLFLVTPILVFTPYMQQFWAELQHVRDRQVLRFNRDIEAEQLRQKFVAEDTLDDDMDDDLDTDESYQDMNTVGVRDA